MIKKTPSKKTLPPRSDGSTAPPRRLATVREACSYGHFSHTKAYDYIRDGRIKAYKRDTRTLIDLDTIDSMNAALPMIDPRGKKEG